MKYFAGFDVGSSKTHALIVDETGQCVGFGKAGGGNYQAVGWEGLRTALRESLAAALQMSGIDKDRITGAGFGIAGYDFPSDREAHLQAIASLGLRVLFLFIFCLCGSCFTLCQPVLFRSRL